MDINTTRDNDEPGGVDLFIRADLTRVSHDRRDNISMYDQVRPDWPIRRHNRPTRNHCRLRHARSPSLISDPAHAP
jgi:hypothetical protein